VLAHEGGWEARESSARKDAGSGEPSAPPQRSWGIGKGINSTYPQRGRWEARESSAREDAGSGQPTGPLERSQGIRKEGGRDEIVS
jgi:hypothetical protein